METNLDTNVDNSNVDIKKIQSKNCIKYFFYSILFNPLLIWFGGVALFFLCTYIGIDTTNLLVQLISIITLVGIISTVWLIPVKLFKLRKNGLIGKKCFIFIFIFWLVPFLFALHGTGGCGISSIATLGTI